MVELVEAVRHAHARVWRAAGIPAVVAAGCVVRCAIGWRRERLEADRAARLGRSSHLGKEQVQSRAERLGLSGPHRCVRLAT